MPEEAPPYHAISDKEYGFLVASLHEKAARDLAEGRDEKTVIETLEKAEWDLTIDHRLGKNIPEDLREAFHRFKRELNEGRDDLASRYHGGPVSTLAYIWKVNRLPHKVAKKFAKSIPKEYIRRLLGPFAFLPINPFLMFRGRNGDNDRDA